MKTLMTALAVIAALTLIGTAAQAAQSASQIAASWCSDPGRVGRDGLTCAQAAAVKAQEMVWYEAYEDWLIVRGRLPETDNEFKKWNRDKISLALGCAYSVKDSGTHFRTPTQFQRAALTTYNRIMARRFESRQRVGLNHCDW